MEINQNIEKDPSTMESNQNTEKNPSPVESNQNTEKNPSPVESNQNTEKNPSPVESNQKIEKKTKGRQKLPLVRMEKDGNRLVTFSKRRSGLFKKASELCTLCGVEAAIIVFSPGKKAFSFGHPSIDGVLNRYISDTNFLSYPSHYLIGQTSKAVKDDEEIKRLSTIIGSIRTQYEMEIKRTKDIIKGRKANVESYKWLAVEESKNEKELVQVYEALAHVTKSLYEFYPKNVQKLTADDAGYHHTPNFFGAQHFVSNNLFGDQSQNPMAMVPPNSVRGLNDFDLCQRMIQAPLMEGAVGDPSLSSIRANTIALNLLKANTNVALNFFSNNPVPRAQSDLPNYPNSMLPFPGEYNPMGGSQYGGHPSFEPKNIQALNPMWGNFEAGPSMPPMFNELMTMPASTRGPNELMNLPVSPRGPNGMLTMLMPPPGPNGMDDLAPPFNLQGGFEFGSSSNTNDGLELGNQINGFESGNQRNGFEFWNQSNENEGFRDDAGKNYHNHGRILPIYPDASISE
ncbi:uncharacterized protein LOC130827115 [Amaranthus tricolor]|uniref:uncharacterized protein LOC130827115 n=1 Tax=Amaranthus tricolor TaxID=29722 RepID=UPI002590F388|nr:uncharacterized protein LOC130827115 [Amaranthus tricolor]